MNNYRVYKCDNCDIEKPCYYISQLLTYNSVGIPVSCIIKGTKRFKEINKDQYNEYNILIDFINKKNKRPYRIL